VDGRRCGAEEGEKPVLDVLNSCVAARASKPSEKETRHRQPLSLKNSSSGHEKTNERANEQNSPSLPAPRIISPTPPG
jgi:hypothetical protein